jgi:ankyrin repeat protein
MELLIEHGANIEGRDGGKYSAGQAVMESAVNDCLRNGRGQAAEFLARRGARLDLEGAAGVGRLDIVKSFFDEDGRLKPPATTQQMRDGFAWACEFGRTEVVDFLLRNGMKVDEKLKYDAQTGLHWAAYGGHPDIVRLLLQHGAPVEIKDETHGGTPLGWALYGWGGNRTGQYYEVVARLVQAGARIDQPWYEEDVGRRRALEEAQFNPKMLAALRGETAPG